MVSLLVRPSPDQEAHQVIRTALTTRFYSTADLGGLLTAEYRPYLRQAGCDYLANNFLLSLQPFTAWVGLMGVILIFIIASAMWWDTPATPAKVFAAYGAVSPPYTSTPYRQITNSHRAHCRTLTNFNHQMLQEEASHMVRYISLRCRLSQGSFGSTRVFI